MNKFQEIQNSNMTYSEMRDYYNNGLKLNEYTFKTNCSEYNVSQESKVRNNIARKVNINKNINRNTSFILEDGERVNIRKQEEEYERIKRECNYIKNEMKKNKAINKDKKGVRANERMLAFDRFNSLEKERQSTLLLEADESVERNRDGANYICIIADVDTITGFLLAGIGDNDRTKGKNYLIVEDKTSKSHIETTFKKFVSREDVAIVLISQKIAEEIRNIIEEYDELIPVVLEIPDPSNPYSAEKDTIMMRLNKLLGTE